jgi:hypothetical protein
MFTLKDTIWCESRGLLGCDIALQKTMTWIFIAVRTLYLDVVHKYAFFFFFLLILVDSLTRTVIGHENLLHKDS